MPETVVITGKMSYHANITMAVYLAEEIMPRVWAERPGVQLEIVGKDPSPEVQNLGEHKNVSVIGGVPDLRPYIQKATVAAAPILYGVGIQNKVLEAMACGTPVVVTPQAVSAIDVNDG
ncbi:MAG: glycosyltransferase, partial [Gammaproteobacteria bacterium]|nr:glycosyltransferase [Gammaproteobacteria bacterium]